MNNKIQQIVIVGGGSAGWLTAAILASQYAVNDEHGIQVTLIESSTVSPIGVGEGTWPSMRSTLEKIGLSETDFLIQCDASFKQGSKFIDWHHVNDGHYFHPFTFPVGMEQMDLAPYWLPHKQHISFADAVTPQGHLCQKHLAPKQISTAEYAYNANYGYHLDAGKFTQVLRQHCVEKLGITHIVDHIEHIKSHNNGDIATLITRNKQSIQGDLFIDCSGVHGLLIEQHFGIPLKNQKNILFNDSAWAVHVPYTDEQSPIASCTLSTAQTSGWVWDIGLPSRRGVGHTYSSAHITDEQAEQQLREYITPAIGATAAEQLACRKINFNPGYRQKFWHKNCVAVGMAAGFIEPLEASALVMIELAAQMICDQLPKTRSTMDVIAKHFNHKFSARWEQIIEFLKLHYVLSERKEEYWLENRCSSSIPQSLLELLELWQSNLPSRYDITDTDALFPAASYQYVLYGMGYSPAHQQHTLRHPKQRDAEVLFNQNMQQSKQLLAALPTNRELLNKIKQYGLPKL
ncbi:tryptophan halogenase family protein [Neptunicella marina]|uniref:Tryptophan 7-halogenase n=1 Tax=Neptunicella marina TaxID=2125989 RepID=A0A8J6IUY3_9ALTE|nr:tryptophan halogenase family protein [Neptunicella marina]MBC3766320.1 tryptophan 7-halogenase [Neptunicella marina]